jgi:transposase
LEEEAARDLVRAREDARGDLMRARHRPKSRRDALDKAIAELAATPPYVDVVERLVCLRGVSTLTAFALTVELGDWHGFRPESLGPFLWLTPSEHSSGQRRRQGAITKTGNSHVRRLLIEAAWHQRSPSRRSITLERRRDGKPLAVQAQAERSARRLHARWHALEARGKPRSIVVVAVARELAGHCWALATME